MGIRKATAERFNQDAYALVVELGGVPAKLYPDERLELPTKAGPLYVWPLAMPWRGKQRGHFTVCCHFEDVDQANAVRPSLPFLNPYSGKYNLHVEGHDADAESALLELRKHLEPLLVNTSNNTKSKG